MRWFGRLFGRPKPPADRRPEGKDTAPVCRPAGWNDVLAVVRLLEAHDVDYVLVGGYALQANGILRYTVDVDVLVRNTPENNVRWIRALSALPDGATRDLMGESDPFQRGAEDDLNDDEPGVIRVLDEFVVDVMPKVCGLT